MAHWFERIAQRAVDKAAAEGKLSGLAGEGRPLDPERLRETAYALACDVSATDGATRQTELRLLQEMRHELDIDRLHAAAIEYGARARYRQL